MEKHYYFISFMSSKNDSTTVSNTVADEHPFNFAFVTMKGSVVIINWKEITYSEYLLFKELV